MHRLFRHFRARHQAFRELAGRALPKRRRSLRRRQPRLEELEDRRLLSSGDANNLILMIADGQGFNSIRATNYWVGSPAIYEAFPVRYGVRTTSASGLASGYGYDPASMASNFNYAKDNGATDSAAAATAMYTGQKVYDLGINWSTSSQPLTTFFENAAQDGKSIGAVSSVQVSHATPGSVYGHNSSRTDYVNLAKEAIYGSNPIATNNYYDAGNYNGNLQVVMGAGHPNYNDNGVYQPSVTDSWVGGTQAWTDLGNGVNGWTRVDTTTGIQDLASGVTPDKVFGIARVNQTLQAYRDPSRSANDKTLPYADPQTTGLPTLEDMTRAALNVLDNNPNGFAVMIEGGAVDWANHPRRIGRMIEEEIDFNNSVQAVVNYLDANTNGNNWSNTLLIVTADHETGYLWGDGSSGATFFDVNSNGVFNSGVDYAHVKDNGRGQLPSVWYFSGSHSNSLVPLFAKGAGSELFANHILGTEPNLRAFYDLDTTWTGHYIDNTSIFTVMSGAVNVAPTGLGLSSAGVAENQSAGTTVGTFTTTDPDLPDDSHMYTLVTGPGDTDNGAFAIVDDQLESGVVFDYETKSSYSIRVRTTDHAGLWFEEVFAITVTDVDDIPPTVTVTVLTTNDTTPTITGTVSDGALQVMVHGKTYTAGDGNLTVSGTNWTLPIPAGDALPLGTYDVTASATDTAGNVGSDSTTDELRIVKLIVTSLAPTPSGFVAQFSGEFQRDGLNLYDGAGGTLGPADVILQDSANQVVAGSLAVDGSRQAITFVKTGGVLMPGRYAVTLRSGGTAFRALDGESLDGNKDGTTGDDFTASFTVGSSSDRVVSIPDFARGAGQPVNIPNLASGLPIRIDNADGVTSVAVDLAYDQDLLEITAAGLAAGLPADWGVVNPPDTSTPGVVQVRASGTTALSGTNVEVVRLTAAVPSTASYGPVQAIRLDNVALNGGTIAAIGDVAVHKAVYLGDADSSGVHSAADAFLTVQAGLGLASGCAAHAWTDPRIVGDADGSNLLSAADALPIVQEGLGLSESFVPDNPHITVTSVGGGMDPQLILDDNLPARRGGLALVPVKLSVDADATNVGGASFRVSFDARKLSINLSTGVKPGTATSTWTLPPAVLLGPGELLIELYAPGTPLAAGAVHEIVKLYFRVDAAAALGTAVLDIEPKEESAGGYTWTDEDGSLLIGESPPAVTPALRYDFGISGSPVQAGFVGVLPQELYSATKGYGWISRVAGADRRDSQMSGLRRDLIYARDATFKVKLAPTQTYNIRLYHANPKGYGTVSYIADNFSVSAEGSVRYTVAIVPAGGTVIRTISHVTVSADGVLELRFRDLGGRDSNFVVSGLEISSGTLPGETPLLAAGDPRDEGAAAVSLSQLLPVVAEATARWAATGLTADQAAALAQAQFVVADLGAAYLGLASPATRVVRIDDDAAGLGWSVVRGQSSVVRGQWSVAEAGGQLTNDKGQLTSDGVDLLTVVMHELGHVLGYRHADDGQGLMSPVLPAGRSSAEAKAPLGQAAWRNSSGALDALFADLAADGPTGVWQMGRVRHEAADPLAEWPEPGAGDLVRPGSEGAIPLRIPRRSRLPWYEREVDVWFDGLARAADESADGRTGDRTELYCRMRGGRAGGSGSRMRAGPCVTT